MQYVIPGLMLMGAFSTGLIIGILLTYRQMQRELLREIDTFSEQLVRIVNKEAIDRTGEEPIKHPSEDG